jgi:hypothetical protein
VPAAAPAPAPAAPKDCHGPAYWALKNADAAQRDKESALNEVQRCYNTVGHALEVALRAEREKLLQAALAGFDPCLRAAQRPSFLCTAFAARDPARCAEVLQKEERQLCSLVLAVADIVEKGDSSRCAELQGAGEPQLCRFLLAREFDCAKLEGTPLSEVCASARAWFVAGSDAAEIPEQHRAPAAWMVALGRQDPAWCAKIPVPKEAAACAALFARSIASCPRVRPTVETADNDWSCRQVLVSQAQHPARGGTELVLGVGSPYPGKAECTPKLEVQVADKLVERTLAPVTFDGKTSWHEVRTVLAGEALVKASVSCTWDRASSRYLVNVRDTEAW